MSKDLLPAIHDEAGYRPFHRNPAPWKRAVAWIADKHDIEMQEQRYIPEGSSGVFESDDRQWILKILPPFQKATADAERAGLTLARGSNTTETKTKPGEFGSGNRKPTNSPG